MDTVGHCPMCLLECQASDGICHLKSTVLRLASHLVSILINAFVFRRHCLPNEIQLNRKKVHSTDVCLYLMISLFFPLSSPALTIPKVSRFYKAYLVQTLLILGYDVFSEYLNENLYCNT